MQEHGALDPEAQRRLANPEENREILRRELEEIQKRMQEAAQEAQEAQEAESQDSSTPPPPLQIL